MKNRIFLPLFLLLTGVCFITMCSLYRRPPLQAQTDHQKSKAVFDVFRESDLSKFERKNMIVPESVEPFNFIVGDVRGDREREIVVVMEDSIAIYNQNGELLEARPFDEMNFGTGILADIDGDGKLDIVVGSAEDKGVTIHAYSGVFSRLLEFRALQIYNAETKIHFYKNGNIYFSAASPLLTSPQVIGAYNVEDEELLWEYHTGPAPIDIAANHDASLLTISNRPANANGSSLTEKPVSDHSENRASLYVLGGEGTVLSQMPIGTEHRSAWFSEDGISSLTQRLYDLDDDGEDELLLGINRLSDFYGGNAALEVRNLEGSLLLRRDFLPATELDFSFYETDKRKEVAVLLNQKGQFYTLDSRMEISHEWLSPGIQGEGILHCSGDLNGDKRIEHLLSIGNYLFILNDRLEPLFSTGFTSDILKAVIIANSGTNPVLLVQAGELHIFSPGKGGYGSATVHTSPPGAEVFVDETDMETCFERGIIQDLPAGEVNLHAQLGNYRSDTHRIKIEEGLHAFVDLALKDYQEEPEPVLPQTGEIILKEPPRIAISHWNDISLRSRYSKHKDEIFVVNGYQDLAGGPEKDFLFRLKGTRLLRTYSTGMELLGQFEAPYGSYTMTSESAWSDTNLDGKMEILMFRQNSQELLLFTAAGKLSGYRKYLDLPDSLFRAHTVFQNGHLYIAISSGYSRQPRGIIGIERKNLLPGFFYPTAAMTTGLVITPDEKLLPTIYTPDNGSTITYSNGDIATDSEYFIHISDLDGRHLSQSFNPGLMENNGHLRFFFADLDNDGAKETYLYTGKTKYREGTCIIAELDTAAGSISETLFTAGYNTVMHILSMALLEGQQILAVFAGIPRELFLLGEDFVPVKKHEVSDPGYQNPRNWFFQDIDGDSTSEMILLNETSVSIYDLDFNLMFSIESDEHSGPFRNLLIDDRDGDGKTDIIIISDKAVSSYSY